MLITTYCKILQLCKTLQITTKLYKILYKKNLQRTRKLNNFTTHYETLQQTAELYKIGMLYN